jgi:hypothetical protein
VSFFALPLSTSCRAVVEERAFKHGLSQHFSEARIWEVFCTAKSALVAEGKKKVSEERANESFG